MFRIRFVGVSLFLLSVKLSSIQCQSIDQQPPSITESPPKLRFFSADDVVTLECKAVGYPEVTYSWKKNSVSISPSNKHRLDGGSLVISSASLEDEGFYQCFAENKHGTAFTNVTQLRMSVIQADGPTQQTIDLNVNEGQPFKIPASSFKVIPQSSSYEDFVWKRNGGINVTPGKRIQIADNGDLYFAYVMTTDDLQGKAYTNSLKNPFSKTEVKGNHTKVTVATNEVKDFPPSLAFASVSRNIALEGETVRLRCFFYGKPEPSITWMRSVDNLPAERFNQTNFNTELTLINITKSDETLYHCLGTNDHGSTIHNITLHVEAAPRFATSADQPHEAYIVEDDTAVFRCNAVATPEATVEWFYNGKSLKEVPRDRFQISDDGRSLSIRSVCRECKGHDGKVIGDTGVIQCNASNVHGYALGSGFLNVITLKQAASLNVGVRELSSATVNFVFIVISAIVTSIFF